MKKFIVVILTCLMLFTSCAAPMFVTDQYGRKEVAEPYGWANMNKENKDFYYRLCTGNLVWSIILSETIVAPIVLTGWGLFEPVEYIGPVSE